VIRLATIGASSITSQFAAALHEVPGIELAGVFSRDSVRAAATAKDWGAPHSWSELRVMLASTDVDAVYVASPNAMHNAQCRAALEAGKHVLVEKPAVVSATEFEDLLGLARDRGVILFEGMRSAYDPGMDLVRYLLPQVGKVRRVSFEYCQRSSRYDQVLAGQPVNIFDPAMAGGALNDLGVYCVSALVDLFGEPDTVVGADVTIASGVDGAGGVLAAYPGFVADLAYSKITASDRPSQIEGELGTLTIDKIAEPSRVGLRLGAAPRQERVVDKPGGNLSFEIERFVRLVADGADPARDQERTLMTLRTMGAIRTAAGHGR
jgi:predicted dehydrogenase